MIQPVFHDHLCVQLEGENILELIEQTIDHMIYKVLGFKQQQILIHDFRTDTFEGVDHFFRTNDPHLFHQHFNAPALALVTRLSSTETLIELRLSDQTAPGNTLWIIAGIGKSIPAYDYFLFEAEDHGEDRLTVVYLYQNPREYSVESGEVLCGDCVQSQD